MAWNVDGVHIPDVCSFDAHEQAIVGTAVHDRGAGKGVEIFKWWAKATPHGYQVILEDYRKLRQQYQGPTFNVFCEVAAAIRRLA